MRVYVAGPLSKGDSVLNVRKAIFAADALLRQGFIPYVPHLTHFWHLVCPHEYEVWMKLDFSWLEACHAVVRLDGESTGAEREVEFAKALGIPVYNSVQELMKAEGRSGH